MYDLVFFQTISSTLDPIVGDVCTTSFIKNWYKMVVLPALSNPTMQILCSINKQKCFSSFIFALRVVVISVTWRINSGQILSNMCLKTSHRIFFIYQNSPESCQDLSAAQSDRTELLFCIHCGSKPVVALIKLGLLCQNASASQLLQTSYLGEDSKNFLTMLIHSWNSRVKKASPFNKKMVCFVV